MVYQVHCDLDFFLSAKLNQTITVFFYKLKPNKLKNGFGLKSQALENKSAFSLFL